MKTCIAALTLVVLSCCDKAQKPVVIQVQEQQEVLEAPSGRIAIVHDRRHGVLCYLTTEWVDSARGISCLPEPPQLDHLKPSPPGGGP